VLARLIFLVITLIASAAHAQTPLFDSHVHLWHGEASLSEYEAQLKAAGREVSGAGVMWFGGPNQALQGQPERVRASNDGRSLRVRKFSSFITRRDTACARFEARRYCGLSGRSTSAPNASPFSSSCPSHMTTNTRPHRL